MAAHQCGHTQRAQDSPAARAAPQCAFHAEHNQRWPDQSQRFSKRAAQQYIEGEVGCAAVNNAGRHAGPCAVPLARRGKSTQARSQHAHCQRQIQRQRIDEAELMQRNQQV